MLLFVVGLAFGNIGYGTTLNCLPVSTICFLFPEIEILDQCINEWSSDYPQFQCLKDIYAILTAASKLNCAAYSTAVSNSDDNTAGNWLMQIITLGTNGQPDTGLLPQGISCTCTLIYQLIANIKNGTDEDGTTFCEILECVLEVVIDAGYFTICLVISGIQQISIQTKNSPSCLCNYLIALVNQLFILLKCVFEIKNCKCLSTEVSTGITDLEDLLSDLLLLLNNGSCTTLPPIPNSQCSVCPTNI